MNINIGLDDLLPKNMQVSYHSIMTCYSFFTGFKKDDPFLKTWTFRLIKVFNIVFLFFVCLRRILECIVPEKETNPFFIYIGDFKIWWGHPYIANQVVFVAAAFIVPTYQFINVYTLCRKDIRWIMPFQFMEGLKSARQIGLEDQKQVNALYKKMKLNFWKAHVLKNSVFIPYTISVFLSFVIFYKSYLKVWTLGLFWTIFEARWSYLITTNMGIYPACLDSVTYYLKLRYEKSSEKLAKITSKESTEYSLLAFDLKKLIRILSEIDSINATLRHCNHYWRKYLMAVFASYVPQILFEIYVCFFLNIGTSMLVFSIFLIFNVVGLISELSIHSARIHSKAYSMEKSLWAAFNQISRRIDGCSKKTSLIRDYYKLSFFIEQYNHAPNTRLGLYLLDFYLINWHFYYELVVNCVMYFLLIVSVLQN